MLTRTIKTILQYFKDGFYSHENYEETLKVYLIYSFSLIGFVFVFILGLKGFDTSNTILTTFLLGGSVVLLFNIIYLKRTYNYMIAGYIVLYLFFSLMLYLIYSGGVDNTGPLWIFCLPPIALYIHGIQRGLLDLTVFMFIMTFILFYPDENFLEAQYTTAFKVRIVLSFLLVTFLSVVYGYSREKSSEKMLKMRKDLEFFLRRDELTGLYNRRGYQDKIENIKHDFGSILMCDIDYFKNVNDTYGHDVGDFVIREVSKCIRNNLRKDDIAVRWGGEEFFVYLAQVNRDHAYLISEKLRECIETLSMQYDEEITIHVTMSIGIAFVDERNTLDMAIGNADKAMYLSKEQGRNKSTIYPG